MAKYTQENRWIKVIETPLPQDTLLLQRFNGEEAVSRLFHFDLQMQSENRSIKFSDIVGKKLTLSIQLANEDSFRYINGHVSSFSQGGSSSYFAYYHATLVPWTWFLTRTTDCRIFQEKSVPDIIKQIFQEFGFADFKLRLQGTYQPREYCVQYRETYFNFISRLMEEEGIFYFFEHEEKKHTLVLADRPTEFKPCPTQPQARYEYSGEQHHLEDVITGWTIEQEVRPGTFALKDYNFEKPSMQLLRKITGQDEFGYQVYDYPGEYVTGDNGERLVSIRMEEEDSQRVIASGTSICRGFQPGFRFELQDHYRRDLNKEYSLLSVSHSADQGDNFETHEGQGGEDFQYTNQFQCFPVQNEKGSPTPYRPPRTTIVPVVQGSQTALVVGPAGEEIYVDNYGRVKVRFHWDRWKHSTEENSSCWIRVSQNWAGKRWGAMFIPRVGQEVIVDFLEGNPDQPIITGRVYNGDSMPPYTLPDHKTKSTLMSLSSKGGDGYNEIRFEDKKGSEQIFIHGEKDIDVRIKNSRREWIGKDRHLIVKNNKYEKVESNSHTFIDGTQKEEIGADAHLKIAGKHAILIAGSKSEVIGGNLIEVVSGTRFESIGGKLFIKVSDKIYITGSQITLEASGSVIDIGPAGIAMKAPMIKLNSGPAGGKKPDDLAEIRPIKPDKAKDADDGVPGSMVSYQATYDEPVRPKHKQNSEENKLKTHFIEIEFVGEDGKPVSGEEIEVTLPDGTTTTTSTNEHGIARVAHFEPGGSCQIKFVNLDKEAVEPA